MAIVMGFAIVTLLIVSRMEAKVDKICTHLGIDKPEGGPRE